MRTLRSIWTAQLCAVTLLLGCDTGHVAEARPDAGAGDGIVADAETTEDEDAEVPFDGGITAIDPSCRYQWGWVAEPSTHGIVPDTRKEPMLPITPDLVEAITSDGRTIRCGLFEDSDPGRYACRDQAGVAIITVHIGAQSWTRDLRSGCPWSDEDSTSFWLKDVAPCVSGDAVVLEGELLGYDPANPPIVHLRGPFVSFRELVGFMHGNTASGKPNIDCSLTGSHYACTSIGYRETVQHEVVVNAKATPVSLPVDACVVEPVVLDLEVP